MNQLAKLSGLAIACVVILQTASRADTPAPAATPSQAALLDILKSNASREQKAIACQQIAWIGDRNAVPVLAGLLADENLSHMARYALEQIHDPAVEESLRAAVPKLKGKLLVGVLSSLGARRDVHSIELLRQLGRESPADSDVANAAWFALGKIGTPAAGQALEEAMLGPAPTGKPKLFTGKETLVAGAAVAVRPALCDAALRCADRLAVEGHREEAVRLYDRIAASHVPIQFRVAATRGAVLHGPRAQALLAELLESNDRAMFNLSLQLAHEFPSAEATATYAGRLEKLSHVKQALLIHALGQRGDKAALPAIRALAGQSDPAVHIAVVCALAALNDTASFPTILEAALSTDKQFADTAIGAIVKMPGNEMDAALAAMTESPDIKKQSVAIDCLSRRKTASATQALLKIAGEGEAGAKQAAIKALGQGAGEVDLSRAIDVLLKATASEEKTAAANVVVAICISATDKEACTQKIVAAMASAAAEQKPRLLRVLSAVGGANGLRAVRGATKADSSAVQDEAFAALCAWPDQAASPDLLALARDTTHPSNVHGRALHGYLRLALDVDLAPERRLDMAANAEPLLESDEQRRLWLRVLSRIQSPKSLTQIVPFLDQAGVKTDAATAAVAVAGKIAQTVDAQKVDAKAAAAIIVAAMDRVKQANPSPDLVKKASDIEARVRPFVSNKD